MKKIILTGGGSAGHVIPNVALINELKKRGFEIFYIGSNGLEKTIIQRENVPFYEIKSGKLRRYFSLQNFIDPFKILYGIFQSFFLCRRIKPNVVFAKGGFVSFPVVVGAWLNRIKIVAHESDLSVGLANKLCYFFCNKFCVTFSATANLFNNNEKVIFTGTPIRHRILEGDKEKGRKICGFPDDGKKVILFIAGSLGSHKINEVGRSVLPQLLEKYNIIHICGRGNCAQDLVLAGYKQFEYVNEELADLYALANIVVSRAGSNSIYELIALRKPHILIPLTLGSRGDQVQNARYFSERGYSSVISENNLSSKILYDKIWWLDQNENFVKEKLKTFVVNDAVSDICDVIDGI